MEYTKLEYGLMSAYGAAAMTEKRIYLEYATKVLYALNF